PRRGVFGAERGQKAHLDNASIGFAPSARARLRRLRLAANFSRQRPGVTMHPPPGAAPKIELPNVKSLIAVASGKGGVGKSTVAANLAMALKHQGNAVGLMDADIYGPSVPKMMGLGHVDPRTTMFPLEKFGLKLMSMGFIVPPEQAVI